MAFGTVGVGTAITVIAVLGLLNIFNAFLILPFVVNVQIIIMGLLLSCSTLKNSLFVTTYFAFLRFPIGSGSLLIIAGAVTYDTYGISGNVVGGIAFGWGVLCIVCHFFWRGKGAAYNVTLLK